MDVRFGNKVDGIGKRALRLRLSALAGASLGAMLVSSPAQAECVVDGTWTYCFDSVSGGWISGTPNFSLADISSDVYSPPNRFAFLLPGVASGYLDLGDYTINASSGAAILSGNVAPTSYVTVIGDLNASGASTPQGSAAGIILLTAPGTFSNLNLNYTGNITVNAYRDPAVSPHGNPGIIANAGPAGTSNVSSTGNIAVTVSGVPALAGGIWATGGAGVNVSSVGNITVEAIGASSGSGILADSKATTLIYSQGDVDVSLGSGVGSSIVALGTTNYITSLGNVTNDTASGMGIVARGPVDVVDGVNTFGIADYSSVYSEGNVETGGDGSHAIAALGTTAIANSNGTLATHGDNSSGIIAMRNYTFDLATNVGTPDGGGTEATVYAAGSIATEGKYSYGIAAVAMNGKAFVSNSAAISTSGQGSYGIYATGKDARVFNSGAIETTGPGSANFGPGSSAIAAHSVGGTSGTDYALVFNTGTVTTSGDFARGIVALAVTGPNPSTSGDAVIDTAGSINTTGFGATGAFAYSATGNSSVVLNGNVTTNNNLAVGLTANAPQQSASVDAQGAIATAGGSSPGIIVSARYAKVQGTATITATGQDSDGILVGNFVGLSSSDFTGPFAINAPAALAAIDYSGDISATGTNSSGIRTSADQVIINTGGTITGALHGIDATSGVYGIELGIHGGSVSGGTYGVNASAPDSYVNMTVAEGANVWGGNSGAYFANGYVSVSNAGTIHGNGAYDGFAAPPDAGITGAGSQLIVNNSGTISGAGAGITTAYAWDPALGALVGRSAYSFVDNSGTIVGQSNDGVRLIGGGGVQNAGLISGTGGTYADGISMYRFQGQSFDNFNAWVDNNGGGTIEGQRFGVILSGGGSIENDGEISGGLGGTLIQSDGTSPGQYGYLWNANTITGNSGFGAAFFGNLEWTQAFNFGTIQGATDGVEFAADGGLTLYNSGTVMGGERGIYAGTNTGVIDIFIDDGGVVSGSAQGIFTEGTVNRQITNHGLIAQGTPDPDPTDSTTFAAINIQPDVAGVNSQAFHLIDSYGTIQSAAAGIIVGFGGGRINNNAGASISGDVGISQPSLGGTGYRLDVWNQGTISGTGGTALDLANAFNLIVNSATGTINGAVNLGFGNLYNGGTINGAISFGNGMGGGNDLVANGGIINGNISFGNGNDTFQNNTGSQFASFADGGAGYDTLVLQAGAGFAGGIANFEGLRIEGGTWFENATLDFLDATITGGVLTLTGSASTNVTTSGTGHFRVGDLGSFTGNLVNNGTFSINKTSDYNFVGDFSGTGTLAKYGSGVLNFTGNYNFTGTTQLFGGSVRFAGMIDPNAGFDLSSGTLDLSGSSQSQTIASLGGTADSAVVVGTGGLTVNQGTNTVYSGSISGDGSLTKTGDGNLNLTGTNTYTGPTTIDGGILSVNGSIQSPTTVNTGGTLGGTGTTSNVTVTEGGTFAPGNSIGTITVAGDLVFRTGSIYAVEANAAGQSDRINATGTVTIQGGTVKVLAENQTYNTSTLYTIIGAAGGLSGKFSGVTSNLAFLTPSLGYSGSAVTLTLTRNDTTFPSVALNNNQASVANAMAKLNSKSPIFTSMVSQSVSGAQKGFAALSGQLFADLSGSLLGDAANLRSTLSLSGEGAEGVSSFASGLSYRQAPAAGLAGASSARLAGNDGSYTLGTTFAHDGWRTTIVSGRTDLGEMAESAGVATSFLGANVSGAIGPFSLTAGGGLAWHDVTTDRGVRIGEFADYTTATFAAVSRQAFAEVSYGAKGRTGLTPYAGLSLTQLATEGFSERGHEAALDVAAASRTVATASLGLRAALEASIGDGWRVRPMFDAAIERNFGDLAATMDMRFAGTQADFRIATDPLPRTSLAVDGAVVLGRGGLDFSLGYRRGATAFGTEGQGSLALSLAF